MSKIMLVEDDATMLSLLQTLLQMEGFTVSQVSADEVEEIVSEIRQEEPELTLIDVHLRQISGLEILKQIRQDAELKDLFVLMSSGMDVGHKCLQAGADGFILKPYMPDELIKKIREIMNTARPAKDVANDSWPG
jgi:DNA-binding response OmpR family regulator